MPRSTAMVELVLLAHGVVILVAGLTWYAFRGERINPHARGRAGGRHSH